MREGGGVQRRRNTSTGPGIGAPRPASRAAAWASVGRSQHRLAMWHHGPQVEIGQRTICAARAAEHAGAQIAATAGLIYLQRCEGLAQAFWRTEAGVARGGDGALAGASGVVTGALPVARPGRLCGSGCWARVAPRVLAGSDNLRGRGRKASDLRWTTCGLTHPSGASV